MKILTATPPSMYRESMLLQHMSIRGQAPLRLVQVSECLLHQSSCVSISLNLSFSVDPGTPVLKVQTLSQRFDDSGQWAGGRRPQELSLAVWECWWLLWWSGCSGSSERLAHLCACSNWSDCRKNVRKPWIRIILEKGFCQKMKRASGEFCFVPDQLGLRKSQWDFLSGRFSSNLKC